MFIFYCLFFFFYSIQLLENIFTALWLVLSECFVKCFSKIKIKMWALWTFPIAIFSLLNMFRVKNALINFFCYFMCLDSNDINYIISLSLIICMLSSFSPRHATVSIIHFPVLFCLWGMFIGLFLDKTSVEKQKKNKHWYWRC